MKNSPKNVQRFNSMRLRGNPEKDTVVYIESKDPEISNIRIRKNDDYWAIDTNSMSLPYVDHLGSLEFSRPEDAARVAYTFVQSHRKVVAAVPIPSELYLSITRVLDNERRGAEALRTLCFEAEIHRRNLIGVLKTLKVPAEILEQYDDESPLEFIDRLTLDGDDVPFFSESKLYKLVGKDDARTILAAIAKLKRAADPVRGAL